MSSMVAPGSQAEQVGRLFLAVVIILCLPTLPFGNYLVYPFMILTTWFHEMGHGLTANLVWQEFEQLQIFADGSGLAQSRVDADISPFASAAIAAGGPLAPCIVGSVLILASAHEKLWQPALWGMSAAIFASVIFYVRSPVGYYVLPMIAAAIALLAWRASPAIQRFALQFLGVLGALSMLRDFNYLFTEEVIINGQFMLSDTGQMEAALHLPHWFWASLILLVSAVMVGASLKYALSGKRWQRNPKRLPANVSQFRDRKR